MKSTFARAGIFTIVVFLLFIAIWELTLRKKGYRISYDDSATLWSYHRARVYEPQENTTVFIGSSRIKFDLDIPTWKKLTGEDAVQLAAVGSTPFPFLMDLANDPNFKGKLVVDITEPLYFSMAPPNTATPYECIKAFKNVTPSEKFSFGVSRRLESQFVFLNKEYLSLNSQLLRLKLPRREKVFIFPYFPFGFKDTDFNRQERMLDFFIADTSLQRAQQQNWVTLIEASKAFPPPSPEQIEQTFAATKEAVNKIKSRGGKVIFVRTPSNNPMLGGEQMLYPRDKYWNRLLEETQSPGIHFQDYAETSHFICPEWSHLTPADAVIYTRHLVEQFRAKGWQFNQSNSAKQVATKN